MARHFKLAAEDLGGTLDFLAAVLWPDAVFQLYDPIQLKEHAAAITEEVYDDLVVLVAEAKSVLGFEIEGMFLLLCGHRGARRLA